VRVLLLEELHRNLKRRAIDEGIPLKNLVEKALEEYIGNHPPIQLQQRLPIEGMTENQNE
jgi:hypothetical protein